MYDIKMKVNIKIVKKKKSNTIFKTDNGIKIGV